MIQRTLFVFGFVAAAASDAQAASLHATRDGGARQERAAARRLKLRPFQNSHDLRRAIARGELVSVPDSGPGFVLDPEIGSIAGASAELFRYARPLTIAFVRWFASVVNRRSGDTFRVTSLVRTTAYQRLLRRRNGNAARGTSSHEFGTTADLSKVGVSRAGLRCARDLLLRLENRGVVLATEEVAQSVFHVMVIPRSLDEVFVHVPPVGVMVIPRSINAPVALPPACVR